MFVLTVDQVDSRRRPDFVEDALATMTTLDVAIPFTRTVGDEFQGALVDATSVVAAVLLLLRAGEWHVGLGIGSVDHPLPTDTRAARGTAFLAARTAVERAKSEPSHLSVVAAAPAVTEAEDAGVVFQLLTALHQRRSVQGWAAVDEMLAARSQAEAATRLGISRQAVGQRLHAASWALEQRTMPVLARMLTRADAASNAADGSEGAALPRLTT